MLLLNLYFVCRIHKIKILVAISTLVDAIMGLKKESQSKLRVTKKLNGNVFSFELYWLSKIFKEKNIK